NSSANALTAAPIVSGTVRAIVLLLIAAGRSTARRPLPARYPTRPFYRTGSARALRLLSVRFMMAARRARSRTSSRRAPRISAPPRAQRRYSPAPWSRSFRQEAGLPGILDLSRLPGFRNEERNEQRI